MKRHHGHGNSYKEKNLSSGLASSFRGLVHYSRGRKRDGAQADMVLEKELRVQHLDPQAAGRDSEPLGLTRAYEISKPISSDTLQQGPN